MIANYDSWRWEAIDLNGRTGQMAFQHSRAFISEQSDGWYAIADDRTEGRLHLYDSAGKARARGPYPTREEAETQARHWNPHTAG